MRLPLVIFGLVLELLLALAGSSALAANRLDDIRARGVLRCGVWPHVAGFAVEREGQYEGQHESQFTGFEIDLCRAVAAAVLGEPGKVSFVPVENVAQLAKRPPGGSARAEPDAVSDSGDEVDLVIRRLTWTLDRETSNGLTFGPVVFHDGQGFLVPSGSGVSHAAQLSGERVCVLNMEHQDRKSVV